MKSKKLVFTLVAAGLIVLAALIPQLGKWKTGAETAFTSSDTEEVETELERKEKAIIEYLNSLKPEDKATLSAPPVEVTGCTYIESLSHQSTLVAAMYQGVLLQLVDVNKGEKCGGQPRLVTNRVGASAISPDGKKLAVCSETSLLIFNVGQPLTRLKEACLENGTCSATFSPDGKMIATVSKSGIAQLWDANTLERIGLPMLQESGPSNGWYRLCFTPDGEQLLIAENSTMRFWDVKTQTQQRFPIHMSDYTTLFTCPDNERLVCLMCENEEVGIYDIPPSDDVGLKLNYNPQKRIRSESGMGAINFKLSPDGAQIAIITEAGTVELCDIATNKRVGKIIAHDWAEVRSGVFINQVIDVFFTPGDKELITVCRSKETVTHNTEGAVEFRADEKIIIRRWKVM